MSNYQCKECGTNHIDCGQAGYKTARELQLERQAGVYQHALHLIIMHGPSCQYDKECPLNNGAGFDQGCATCSVVLARKGLKDGNITK